MIAEEILAALIVAFCVGFLVGDLHGRREGLEARDRSRSSWTKRFAELMARERAPW